MKSMTGYGSHEAKIGNGRLFIEIKSINHRYCDIQIKMPAKMTSLDLSLRKLINQYVERGKVEVFLKEKVWIKREKKLSIDMELAKKYNKCLHEIQNKLPGSADGNSLLDVIDLKDLIVMEDTHVDYSKYWNSIKKITEIALKKMDNMRLAEGNFLVKDQTKRLKNLVLIMERIDKQSVLSIKKTQKKHVSKTKKNALNGYGEDRLENELISIGDKLDISEEIIRFKSHVDQYRTIIKHKGPVGRKLDFLLQEMNREMNTIGSKSCDSKISSNVVIGKSELEKLREQIQNIE